MAVEKIAFDPNLICGMEQCRKDLTDAVDEFEKTVKSATKRAIRQRIRKATEKIEFDKLTLSPNGFDPSKKL